MRVNHCLKSGGKVLDHFALSEYGKFGNTHRSDYLTQVSMFSLSYIPLIAAKAT